MTHEHDEALPEGDEAPPPGVSVMSVVRWLLVALMAAAAIGSIAYTRGVFAPAQEAKVKTLYHCPMHPSVVQDHPGDCPICGMDLVPIADRGAASQPAKPSDVPGLVTVELTPDRVQLSGIKTATVTKGRISAEIRAIGFVAAAESGLASVQVRTAGWIEAMPVAETGVQVRRGQVLAALYSPEVLNAEHELINALRWSRAHTSTPAHGVPSGRELLEAARRRLELLGLSEDEIDRLARSDKVERTIDIRAPAAGWVIAKNAVLGAYVEPGTELFQIADLSTVWVLADVFEHEVARLSPGQRARIAVTARAGLTAEGRVELVYPVVNAETRTFRVRIALKNKDLRFRPGMYTDALVETGAAETLVVPSQAIIDTGELQYVFVALGGGKFEPRRVRAGARQVDRVEVLGGLREGEVVVTTANFLIDSESRLRAAIHGFGHAEH